MNRILCYLRSIAALRRGMRAIYSERRKWTQILDAMHDRMEREPHRETILSQRERQSIYARLEVLAEIEEAILYGRNHE